MNTRSSGYVLVTSLMIISLSIITITYVSFRATAYIPFAQATLEREKAMQLALGGVQVAIAQLSQEPEKKEQEKGKQYGNDRQQQAVHLLKTLLPVKNQWQTFVLKPASDGINGTLQICIVSEDGKLNINRMYDFKTHTFNDLGGQKGSARKLVETFFNSIKSFTGGDSLFPAFEKFLKERQYKLHDITELLTIKEFEIFKSTVFYEPPAQKSENNQVKRPLYLTDIFTLWSNNVAMNPWLLSDSVSGILGLNRTEKKESSQQDLEILKKFKMNMAWPADWDTLLSPLYGKKFDSLPKGIELYLNAEFETSAFSVISYGKVGKVTQRLLAIVERAESSKEKALSKVVIKKLYWL